MALADAAVTDCTLNEEVNQLGFYGCVTYVRSYSKCCRFTYRRKLANFALLDTNLETCFPLVVEFVTDFRHQGVSCLAVTTTNLVARNTSSTTVFNEHVATQCNVLKTEGAHGTLYAVMGQRANAYQAPAGYTEILRGYHYRYLLSNSSNVAWVDLPSGHYDDAQKARLTAVSSQPGAQLVYTTDGTTPTAQSRKAASGTLVDIPAGTTTLSVGLLVGTTVSAVITRTYEVSAPDAFTPYDITVNVNVDNVGWSRVNFWAWDDQYGDNFTATGTWPGDAVTVAKTVEGRKWYSHTYRIAKRDAMLSFVFSTASGSPQTVNVYDLNKDAFLEIATSKALPEPSLEGSVNCTLLFYPCLTKGNDYG